MSAAREPFEPSKGAVDRAGEALRLWWVDDELGMPPADAGELLFAFRAEFQNPMKKVTVGLRQFVVREIPAGGQVTVGQRLKRAPQIVLKLARHPRMQLSRMQDVGGCRAILENREEVLRVVARIERNWQVKHAKDYTFDEPAESGYRALHVAVERDQRLIEIQLRTPRQHAWAEAVERTDKRLGFNLKGGDGPPVLLEYFRLAGHGLALEERGESADPQFTRQFDDVYAEAKRYFERT